MSTTNRDGSVSNFVELPLAAIHPAAGQPRKHFAGIEELAESLKQAGQLTPIRFT